MISCTRTIAAVGFLGFACSVHAQASVSCGEEPGLTACRQMRYMENLLVTCSGTACDELFESQIRQANTMVDYYFNSIDGIPDAAADVGELAKKATKKVCWLRWRGTADTIGRIQISMNRLIEVLSNYQTMAKITKKETCVLSGS